MARQHILFLSSLLSSFFLLEGCQSFSSSNDSPSSEQAQSTEIPTRPFSTDTLYSLIKAELAAQRKHPHVTLNEYQKTAQGTRDLDIVKRATLIAQYLNAGDEVLSSARLWHELEPNNSNAMQLIATQQIKQGFLDDAFDQSLMMMEQGQKPLFQAIALQSAQQDRTTQYQLLERFRQALHQNPNNADLLTGESLLLHYLGDTARALSSATQAIKADKNNTAAYVLKASLLEKLGEKKEAAKVLKKRLKKEPKNQRLRLQYARLLLDTDLDEAQKQFHILVEASPLDGDLLLSLALVSKELKQWDTAKTYLEHLLYLQKHTSSAYFYLGKIAEQTNNHLEALELFRRVTAGSEYLYAAAAICRLHLQEDKIGQCQTHMQQERTRHSVKDTTSTRAMVARLYLLEADILHRHQAMASELTMLNEALEKFPQHNDLLYARSMLYEQADNQSASEADLRSILQSEPDNANALNSLGYSLVVKTERIQEGYELITRALALDPDNAAIIDSMGWALYRLNRTEEALGYLNQAMQSFPNHEIAAHLGEVLWVTGKQQKARKIWQQGLEDDPDSAIIKETLKRLNAQQQ